MREHPLEEVYLQQGLEGSEMENVLRGLEQQPQKQSEHEQLGEAKARKKSGLGERNEAKPKRPLTGDGGTVKADTTKQAGYYSALNSSLTAVAPLSSPPTL